MGLGVVGSGVARTLLQKAGALARLVGRPLVLRRVLVRDLHKPRTVEVPRALLTTNPEELLANDDVDVVVELMGGEHPALEYLQRALAAGKHVVTANKEVLAKHGAVLLDQASAKGLHLRFEASVGGGIPIIGPLTRDLLGNEISSIRAIINGTTNYILTRMARDKVDYATALREAQGLGYAEADPTNDVEGIDAAYKLAILATLAFRTRVHATDVYREGITRLEAKDFRYAHELGYQIKLLAIGRQVNGAVQLRVHPAMVPLETSLAKVDGAYNAVEVEGDLAGKVMFHGLGAGALPTTSAVVGDLLEIARLLAANAPVVQRLALDPDSHVCPMDDLVTQYYMRLNVADRSGVLAQIGRILGDLDISIASVIQKDADRRTGTAELVIMTHPGREAAVQEAWRQVARLGVTDRLNTLIRVEAA
ncbi:MAG: homoserine dehydrogenase [Chloroflexi bacterium]|nr:homoserine dehydrogenase [Chloroflexota bacterium]